MSYRRCTFHLFEIQTEGISFLVFFDHRLDWAYGYMSSTPQQLMAMQRYGFRLDKAYHELNRTCEWDFYTRRPSFWRRMRNDLARLLLRKATTYILPHTNYDLIKYCRLHKTYISHERPFLRIILEKLQQINSDPQPILPAPHTQSKHYQPFLDPQSKVARSRMLDKMLKSHPGAYCPGRGHIGHYYG